MPVFQAFVNSRRLSIPGIYGVLADAKGHYNVQLGSSENDGLPVDRFSSNESRWLWGSSQWTRGVVARPAVRTEGRRCGNPEGASVLVLADPP
jgi:hypothetical protein